MIKTEHHPKKIYVIIEELTN